MKQQESRNRAANSPNRAAERAGGQEREAPVAQEATADEIVAEEEEFDPAGIDKHEQDDR